MRILRYFLFIKKKKKKRKRVLPLSRYVGISFQCLNPITMDVSGPILYKWNIFIYRCYSERMCFPKLYSASGSCSCWESILPHFVVCACSFHFPGETPAINWWTAACGSSCHRGGEAAKASLLGRGCVCKCIIEMQTLSMHITVFAESLFKAKPNI